MERGVGGFGTPDFICKRLALEERNLIVANSRLKIHIEVHFEAEVMNNSENYSISGGHHLENQYSDHLLPPLISGDYSDAVVVARSQRFPVHKVILATRSTVFAKLFLNNGNGPVVVTIDVGPYVMWEALRYIYTCKVQNIQSIANELLKVASDYKIDGLKALCEESKSDNADKADKLRSKAVDFIAPHAAKLP